MTEETLFHEALAKPAAERAAFLDVACAGQPELRAGRDALAVAEQILARMANRAQKPAAAVP
ncbi:MAG: hypothetical protein ABSG53_17425 [Thermoguttaceae bacterium]|jgi:hypothetical protein